MNSRFRYAFGTQPGVRENSGKTEQPWTIESSADWRQAQASTNRVTIQDGTLVLEGAGEGWWTSSWHNWQGIVDSAEVLAEAEIDLFDNKEISTIVAGSKKPYPKTKSGVASCTDAEQVQHDWYGRCMIAIVDEKRWIMALRSGVDHISWGNRDTIHIITSTDEGRTFSELNRWFDGTPIKGMPYEDGHTHSEPGLYSMPNGDLVLQFWRTGYSSGTKQLRSTDNGKTWVTDIDRIRVAGVGGVAKTQPPKSEQTMTWRLVPRTILSTQKTRPTYTWRSSISTTTTTPAPCWPGHKTTAKATRS